MLLLEIVVKFLFGIVVGQRSKHVGINRVAYIRQRDIKLLNHQVRILDVLRRGLLCCILFSHDDPLPRIPSLYPRGVHNKQDGRPKAAVGLGKLPLLA